MEETKISAIDNIIEKHGTTLFTTMQSEMKNRFPQKYFDEMESKEVSVSLMPILEASRHAESVDLFLKSPR